MKKIAEQIRVPGTKKICDSLCLNKLLQTFKDEHIWSAMWVDYCMPCLLVTGQTNLAWALGTDNFSEKVIFKLSLRED